MIYKLKKISILKINQIQSYINKFILIFMKLPIYLDYASTTPVDYRIYKKMLNYLNIKGIFGNPSSYRFHYFGSKAQEIVELSREKIAKLIHAKSSEIIFTSGATESNNLAIKGVLEFFKSKKILHIITSKFEHKSVLNTCIYLEHIGYEVTYLSPQKNGLINTQDIINAIKKNTILVSIMHVNNEIGSIQDIKKIGNICKKNKIFFHVDATQSVGKIPINLALINIDFLSFSAHKIYGPKGIGVLYIKKNVQSYLIKQIHGGSQEFNLRSGTLPVHQIVGMSLACEISRKEMNKEIKKMYFLRKIFLDNIKKNNLINLNGDINFLLPNIINLSFKFLNTSKLLFIMKYLSISLGSACNSEEDGSSYVLKSLGITDDMAKKSIRFSIGRFTTEEEIIFATEIIKKL